MTDTATRESTGTSPARTPAPTGGRNARDLWRASQRWLGLALAVVTFFGTAAVLTAAKHIPDRDLVLRIHLQPEDKACCAMSVLVNSVPTGGNFPLVPGQATTVSVPFRAHSLDRLELLFSIPYNTSVLVTGAELSAGSHIVGRLTPNDFYAFERQDFAPAELAGDATRFTSSGKQPRMLQNVAIPATSSSFVRWWWGARLDPFRVFFIGVIACVFIACLVGSQFRLSIAMFTGLVVLLAAVRWLPDLISPYSVHDSVAQAIGASSYFGVWKARELRIHYAASFLAVAIGAAAGVAYRLISRAADRDGPVAVDLVEVDDGETEVVDEEVVDEDVVDGEVVDGDDLGHEPDAPPAGEAPSQRRARWRTVAVVALLVAPIAMLTPDWNAAVSRQHNLLYPAAWDSGNLIYWDFLVAHGRTAIRDFWFPYGLQYYFSAGLPLDLIVRTAVDFACWGATLWGSWIVVRAKPRALLRLSILVGGLLFGVASLGPIRQGCTDAGCLPPDRYMLSISVLMLYAAVVLEPKRRGYRAFVAVAVFAIFLLEPAQLGYAVPGLAVLWLVAAFGRGRTAPRDHLIVAGWDAVTFGAPVLAAVVFLAARGQLSGTVDFYRQISALSTYAAVPSDVVGWLRQPGDVSSVLYWTGPLALLLGTLGIVVSRGADRLRQGVVLALGLVAAVLLQKEVVRSGIHYQIWVPPLFGLLLWLALIDWRRRLSRHTVVAIVAACAAGAVMASGDVGAIVRGMADAPVKLATSVDLVSRSGEMARDRSSRFAPERLRNYTTAIPVADALRPLIDARRDRVFLMGDAPIIGAMVGLVHPYRYVNAYDTAPLAAQQEMVRELERHPPKYAVWEPAAPAIDAVPYHVRDPLVYEWAVHHLVPFRTVDAFEIMRPRQAGEPIPLDWWQHKLGAELKMSHLLGVADLPGKGCQPDSPGCSKYLVIRYDPHQSLPEEAQIVVHVDGTQFVIRFATTPGVRQYSLNLDRAWFWNAGRDPHLRTVDSPKAGGGTVSVVDRVSDPNVLY